MALVDLGEGLSVNACHIVSMSRQSFNGDTRLVIHTVDGRELHVKHWPYGYMPVDVYDLEKKIHQAGANCACS